MATMLGETSPLSCTACDRLLPPSEFPASLVGGGCNHPVQTCSACWEQWLQAQVATNSYDRIRCAECPVIIGQDEIKDRATDEVYQRYEYACYDRICLSLC